MGWVGGFWSGSSGEEYVSVHIFIHVILKSHLITCCVKNTLFTFYSKHTCSFFMNIISMYLPILYMSIPIYKYIHMYIGKYIPPDGSEDPSKIFFIQILGTFFW